MKKQLLLFILMILPFMANAHDIEVANADGVTICYNYNSDGTELIVTSMTNYFAYSGNVVIPEEVTIGDRTLRVTSIDSYAFSGCTELTSVTIPNSVTSIGSYAFFYCSALTSVTIPNSVTSIGWSAFENCTALTSVTIPNSVTSIGGYAFRNCIGLTSITIPSGVPNIDFFSGCSGLTSITIPNSVTTIGYNAFENCIGLTSITIPNSVTRIEQGAFRYCSNLTSLTIGNGVTYIDEYAFFKTNLTKVIWLTNTPPSGYTYVKGAMNYVANDQYSSLSNMNIYPFLSSIFEVDGVKYVPVNPSERTCDAIDCVYDSSVANISICSTVSYMGVNMSVQKVQPCICYGNPYIENLTYDCDGPITADAFCGCKNIKSVVLGEKISAIEYRAFSGCSSLQSLVIPNSVKELGNNSFSDCTSLPQIIIPKSVTTIGSYVFYGCTGLKEFVIEDRNTKLTLGSNGSSPLFSSCPLDYVYIGGNISYNTSSYSGYSPFYRNTTLRKVVITDKETEISTNEFYGCTNLQEFTVGDGVTQFGDWAFSGCSKLQSLSFGTQLKTIGKEAFSDCASVTKIVSKATTPPTCSTQALDDISKWNCKLFVPVGYIATYQLADQWKDFFFISEGDGSGTPPIDEKKCAKPKISYSNGKLTFVSETEGAVCQSTITDSDVASYSGDEVQLTVTYNVSVYATKFGYENSDVATATLCWIDVTPKTEGTIDGIANIPANAMLIQSEGGTIKVQGCEEGEQVRVYSINGTQEGSSVSQNGAAIVNTNLQPGSIAIVKVSKKSIKVVIH